MTTKATIVNIPDNANVYINQVLKDDRYPQDTIISIDPNGGLHITVPCVPFRSRYFDSTVPPRQKITCPNCGSIINNASWYTHTNSNKHRVSLDK